MQDPSLFTKKFSEWIATDKGRIEAGKAFQEALDNVNNDYWLKNNEENLDKWKSAGIFGDLAALIYNPANITNRKKHKLEQAQANLQKLHGDYIEEQQNAEAAANKMIKL